MTQEKPEDLVRAVVTRQLNGDAAEEDMGTGRCRLHEAHKTEGLFYISNTTASGVAVGDVIFR
jgi:hypothetical protein